MTQKHNLKNPKYNNPKYLGHFLFNMIILFCLL